MKGVVVEAAWIIFSLFVCLDFGSYRNSQVLAGWAWVGRGGLACKNSVRTAVVSGPPGSAVAVLAPFSRGKQGGFPAGAQWAGSRQRGANRQALGGKSFFFFLDFAL